MVSEIEVGLDNDEKKRSICFNVTWTPSTNYIWWGRGLDGEQCTYTAIVGL